MKINEEEWRRFGNYGVYLKLVRRHKMGMRFSSRKQIEQVIQYGMIGPSYWEKGVQLAIDKFLEDYYGGTPETLEEAEKEIETLKKYKNKK